MSKCAFISFLFFIFTWVLDSSHLECKLLTYSFFFFTTPSFSLGDQMSRKIHEKCRKQNIMGDYGHYMIWVAACCKIFSLAGCRQQCLGLLSSFGCQTQSVEVDGFRYPLQVIFVAYHLFSQGCKVRVLGELLVIVPMERIQGYVASRPLNGTLE